MNRYLAPQKIVEVGSFSRAAVSGIETIVSKEGAMLAVLPKDHQLSEQKAMPLEALTAEPFILLEERRYSEPLEAFRAMGLTPNIRYTHP